MHKFVFILTFVINFSVYQAGLLIHGNKGFEENGSSNPIRADYTASEYSNENPNRNTRQSIYTHISDGQKDIIEIGNGRNKNNVFNVYEESHGNPAGSIHKTSANTGRGPNNGNIGLTGNQPSRNYHRGNSQGATTLGNRFGSDVPYGPDNSRPKSITRTDQSIYKHISDGQIDIIEIGSGRNKNNVFNVYEESHGNPAGSIHKTSANTGRGPNNGNIGLTGNQPSTNYHRGNSQGATTLGNRFGSDVPYGPDNSRPKSTIRTDQSIYKHISDGQIDIIEIGNGRNKNNVFNVYEESHGDPTGSIPKTGSNTGRRPNNGNIGLTGNQPSTNFHIRNSQGETSLGNRFGSNIPRGLDNSNIDQNAYNHFSDGQRDIINIGNGHNKNNVFNINEEPRVRSQRPNSGNVGSPGSPPTTNYYGKYPNSRGVQNFDNPFGSNAPADFYPWNDSSQNRRVKNVITNIGNGIGNRNIFAIQDHEPHYDNRRRTNTEQNNYEPKTNPWTTNTRTHINQDGYNNPSDINTYTSIGHGPNNRNTVIIEGKPIRVGSDLTITTKEHHGRGYATPCHLNGTCRLPAWGVPGLKRKLASNRYWFARSHQASERSRLGFFANLRKLFYKLNRLYNQ